MVCVLVCILSICIGSVRITPMEILNTIMGDRNTGGARIIMYVRMPRTIACICAGAGLAAAGAIIQSVLNNPLAGPNIIGVNAGAGFAAIVFCAFFPQLLPIGAFIGALLSVLLVYNIARKTGASKITIVLAGVAVNSFLNAGTDTIFTFFPDALVGGNGFRIGGMSALQPKVLYPACGIIIFALLLSFVLRNELDVLSLGEEAAASLGMNVKLYRFLLLMCAALLAGASVSFAGLLGFVGLIVPHTARFFVGSEARFLLPMSALLGAIFLTSCDVLARTIFSPFEIPVGIILSFLGGPFFIWLLLRKKGGHISD
ncbi:MAG: iron ABC transporter permease [Oscillospiraceae bacterium]